MARGCVRLPCDEDGGFTCAELWKCEPSATENPAGCVPELCQETGRCVNDELICATESKHADTLPLDSNGCVTRTCDDGRSCATMYGLEAAVCDFSSPQHDYYGCVLLPCTQDEDCYTDYVCDPGTPNADERGCRNRSCTEGYQCPEGFVCAPNAPVRGASDCTTPEAASGGASGKSGTSGDAGTSGASGRAGTSSAGTSAGRSTAGSSTTAGSGGSAGESEEKPGRCVR